MIWITKIKDGKIDFGSEFNEARFNQWAKDHEGKRLRIEHVEPKRSLSQNNYYWFYLGVIEMETGNLASDLHEFFKQKLLPPKYITVKGRERAHTLKVPRSTTSLTKAEFVDYITKIEALTDVPAPDPEEAGFYSGNSLSSIRKL